MFPLLTEVAEELFWIVVIIAGIIIVIVGILDSSGPKPTDEEIHKSHWKPPEWYDV